MSDSLQLGKKAREYESGRRRLKLQVRSSPAVRVRAAAPSAKTSRSRAAGATSKSNDRPPSTNVFSPVQQVVEKRRTRARPQAVDRSVHYNGYAKDGFIVSDNGPSGDSLDESDAFEPVRTSKKPANRRASSIGPPITTDDSLSGLNDIHQMVVEEFVRNAKALGEKVGRAAALSSWSVLKQLIV